MPMDLLSFESATEVPVEVAEPGSTVTVDVVHGLEDAVIFFALRSQDDTRTWSPLSNIARSYPPPMGISFHPHASMISPAFSRRPVTGATTL